MLHTVKCLEYSNKVKFWSNKLITYNSPLKFKLIGVSDISRITFSIFVLVLPDEQRRYTRLSP